MWYVAFCKRLVKINRKGQNEDEKSFKYDSIGCISG